MVAVAMPEGRTKAEILADLERRIEVAEAAAAKAEAAGDMAAFARAMERVHLRAMQHEWTRRRPDGAKCWKCGELADSLFAVAVDCLTHRSELLAERAAVHAKRDAEGV